MLMTMYLMLFSELAVKINTYNAHVDVGYFVLMIFYRVLEL